MPLHEYGVGWSSLQWLKKKSVPPLGYMPIVGWLGPWSGIGINFPSSARVKEY